MASTTSKRVLLQIPLKDEDIPRVMTGYAKVATCEVMLVLLPQDAAGIYARQLKAGGIELWRSSSSDAPGQSMRSVSSYEQVMAELRRTKASAGKTRDVEKRGMWSGSLEVHADDSPPIVRLSRKISSYAELLIESRAGHWHWTIDRKERYFAPPRTETGQEPTLRQAILQALRASLPVLGEACAVRDSNRRAALDPVYAERHPIQEPKPPTRDLVDSLKPPKPAKEPAPPKEKKPRAKKVPAESGGEQGTSEPRAAREKKPRTPKALKAAPTLQAAPQGQVFQFPVAQPPATTGAPAAAPATAPAPQSAEAVDLSGLNPALLASFQTMFAAGLKEAMRDMND